jgi:hypothetical protein
MPDLNMIRNPGNRIHPPLFESNVPAKVNSKLLMTQVIDGLPPQNGYRDPWLDHCPTIMPSTLRRCLFVATTTFTKLVATNLQLVKIKESEENCKILDITQQLNRISWSHLTNYK